jgi:hypothetical protein
LTITALAEVYVAGVPDGVALEKQLESKNADRPAITANDKILLIDMDNPRHFEMRSSVGYRTMSFLVDQAAMTGQLGTSTVAANQFMMKLRSGSPPTNPESSHHSIECDEDYWSSPYYEKSLVAYDPRLMNLEKSPCIPAIVSSTTFMHETSEQSGFVK